MYVVIDAKEEDQLIIQDKEEVLYGYALEANLEGCVWCITFFLISFCLIA